MMVRDNGFEGLTTEQERQHLSRLIAQYQTNIRELEVMLAGYGDLDKPLHLVNALSREREQLAKAQADLATLDTVAGKETPSGPLSTLPRRPFFVGREAYLKTILEAMRPEERTYVVALDGIGGVGKSTLAIEAAYRCQESGLFEAVVWTTAREAELTAWGISKQGANLRSLTDLYYAIARTSGDQSMGKLTPDKQQIRACQLLEKQTTLLVIDNLETLKHVEPFAQFLRRTPVTTKTITTSRERLIDEARLVRVYGMSSEEGLQLLEREAREKGVSLDSEQMVKVYQRTGGIPLAMVWSVGQMSVHGQTVARVLHRLGRAGDNPLVEFCFQGTLDALGSLNAYYILLAAALVPVPTTLDALQAVAGIGDDLDAEEALGRLLQLSLLNEREDGCYELLPLTRTFTEGELGKEARWREDARRRWAEVWVQRLPVESGYEPEQLRLIEAELRAVAAGPGPLAHLTRQVRALLEAMGYQVVSERLVARDQNQLVCRVPMGLGEFRRILLLCVDGEIGTGLVEQISARLQIENAVQAILIAHTRVSPSARQMAEESGSQVRVLTVAEFYRQVIDFSPYVKELVRWYNESELAGHYVDLGCVRYSYDEQGRVVGQDRYKPMDDYVGQWLREIGRNHISILGDYGTGKTSFCRQYAAKQGRRWLADPDRERIPVLINLRDHTKTLKVDSLVTDALVNQYGVQGATFEAFQRYNADGKLLIFFDGFDEMAQRTGLRTAVDNFWELARVVVPGSKVILTCRTPYFRTHREAETLLRGEPRPPAGSEPMADRGNDYIDLRDRPNFEIVHLEPFSDEDIQAVLRAHFPDQWQAYWEQIQRIYNLPDLARRPVLLDMIAHTLPELKEDETINAARLYQVYAAGWLEREKEKGRTLITSDDRLLFAEELAMEMLGAEELAIHYSRIPERVAAYFGLEKAEEIDHFEADVRTCHFLRRDDAGHYGFVHKSFMEFFAASRLHRLMLEDRAAAHGPVRINEEVRFFLNSLFVLQPKEEAGPPCEPPEGFVWVPPGEYILGGQYGLPLQVVRLDKGFFVGRMPVTNAEYARFIEAGGYKVRACWTDKGWQWREHKRMQPAYWKDGRYSRPYQPVVGVTWHEATAYCRWLAAETGQPCRLPSEQEWEKAVRGYDGREYPWGEWADGRCNTAEADMGRPSPVGQFSPAGDSPYGLADAAGNVWEWTTSEWQAGSASWVLRGGSFCSNRGGARCAYRLGLYADLDWLDTGFRVVVSPISPTPAL